VEISKAGGKNVSYRFAIANRRSLWTLICVCLALMVFVPAARGHDGSWSGDIGGAGPAFMVEQDHPDEDPFKGWFNVTASNTGDEAWGDFHFGIYDPLGTQDISNVHFLDASMGGNDPTSSQSPLTWDIDNEVVGATIDLFYYTDPVEPGETATFSVWTDNPDHLSFFGVMFYPTPVPEPGTLGLLLLGSAGLLLRRRGR
jgi:hypothetical protein